MYYELYIDVFFLENYKLCSIGILMRGCLQEGQQAVF